MDLVSYYIKNISQFSPYLMHMPNDEEEIFNKLMDTPSGPEESDNSGKRCVTEFSFDGNQSPEELMEKYANQIKIKMSTLLPISTLEEFLKTNLKEYFERIRGAWQQFSANEITMDQFIQSGIYVLKKSFISIFLDEPAEKPRVELSEPRSDIAQSSTPQPPKLEYPAQTEIKKPTISPASSPSSTFQPISASKPKIKPQPKNELEEFGVKPAKIESVAPERRMKSTLEAIKDVSSELDKVELKPMRFEKLDKSELKSVNVGATLPGDPMYDDFEKAKNLLYKGYYEPAKRALEEIKYTAQAKDIDYAAEKAEEMITNIGVYQMIPKLVDQGDEALETPHKAKEIYEKGLKFAKLIGDDHYRDILDKRITQAVERITFLRRKREAVKQKDEKLRDLIKDNIQKLGKENSLMGLEDIRKYCNAPTVDVVEEVFLEMIEKKEIYAKYFTQSKKVMFDKDNNKLYF